MDTLTLPPDWTSALAGELEKPYWARLQEFLASERRQYDVYPAKADIFAAFELTPLADVRVLLLGQDPYHGMRQAHGLCFSVLPGNPIPPSLRNIFKELQDNMECQIPNHGCLIAWAKQGVLMLNAVLTVRAREANSHKGKGWENFTDAVIRQVSAKSEPVVFVLWGGFAQKKLPLIDPSRHLVIRSAHPSPFSARNGFFGSRPFSQINAALKAFGQTEIVWEIPDLSSDGTFGAGNWCNHHRSINQWQNSITGE